MKFKKSLKKTLKGFKKSFPIMLSIILFLGILKVFISYENIATLFTKNEIIDSGLGALIGSIMVGNSLNSYIMGEEFLTNGISIYAVSAFLIAWVTVGFVNIPAEMKELGVKFSLYRNLFAIISSIIIGFLIGQLIGGVL